MSQWQTFFQSFTHKMAAKAIWHRNDVTVILCIMLTVSSASTVCCVLELKVDNIDRVPIGGHVQVLPQYKCPFTWGIRVLSPYDRHPKEHLDRFNRFCTARQCSQHADTHTTLRATFVTLGRIYAVRASGR